MLMMRGVIVVGLMMAVAVQEQEAKQESEDSSCGEELCTSWMPRGNMTVSERASSTSVIRVWGGDRRRKLGLAARSEGRRAGRH